jgi:hypothetical protein
MDNIVGKGAAIGCCLFGRGKWVMNINKNRFITTVKAVSPRYSTINTYEIS